MLFNVDFKLIYNAFNVKTMNNEPSAFLLISKPPRKGNFKAILI